MTLVCIYTAALNACTTVDPGSPHSEPNPDAGVLIIAADKQIPVLPEELVYSGEATFVWPDGRRRSGLWLDGQLQGMGTEQIGDEHYSGQWLDGERHGHGEVEFADGSRYVGDFQHGLASGKGTWTSRGSMYQGSWRDGKKHGEGQFNGANGTVYQGQWQHGRRDGYGRQQFPGGGIYEGDWLDDKPHGFGRFLFPTGATYEGSWLAGARDGYGTWHSPANLAYEGTWRDDQRNGFGRESRPDGSFYAGQWQQDERHGKGREVHADGSVHEGAWEHNRILGDGTRTNPTGIRISGHWQDNTISRGILTLPDGAEYQGALFNFEGRAAAATLVQWLTQKASEQNPQAQVFLASLYLDFLEPKPDPSTALVWLRKGAEAGVPEAQYRLAMLLIEEDLAVSMAWLKRAAAARHPAANEVLGEYLHTGKYLAQDHDAAIACYEIAAAGGSVNAINNWAWLLATSDDDGLADPERAIELIQPFVLYFGSWQHMDTLAAAHARLGDFGRAQRLQNQALIQARSLAPDNVLDDMSARLDLYNSEQIYIE